MSRFFAIPPLSLSIKRKILGIALTLIVLMVVTSVLSMVIVHRVSDHFSELSTSYVPAYGDLARANIRSLERALVVRRMVIARSDASNDRRKFEALRESLNEKGAAVEREILSARGLIGGLILKGSALRRRDTSGAHRQPARRTS